MQQMEKETRDMQSVEETKHAIKSVLWRNRIFLYIVHLINISDNVKCGEGEEKGAEGETRQSYDAVN